MFYHMFVAGKVVIANDKYIYIRVCDITTCVMTLFLLTHVNVESPSNVHSK